MFMLLLRWRATRPHATPPHGACGRSCSIPTSTPRSVTTSTGGSGRRSRSSGGRRRVPLPSHRDRPAELHGREIAEGDKVVMWYILANRDESVFDDPFRFDITRDAGEQVAFGAGTTSASAPTCAHGAAADLPRSARAHPRHAHRRRSPRSCARISSAASAHAGGVHPGTQGSRLITEQVVERRVRRSARRSAGARSCRDRAAAASTASR